MNTCNKNTSIALLSITIVIAVAIIIATLFKRESFAPVALIKTEDEGTFNYYGVGTSPVQTSWSGVGTPFTMQEVNQGLYGTPKNMKIGNTDWSPRTALSCCMKGY
jgi:hypothetical protein